MCVHTCVSTHKYTCAHVCRRVCACVCTHVHTLFRFTNPRSRAWNPHPKGTQTAREDSWDHLSPDTDLLCGLRGLSLGPQAPFYQTPP